MSRTAIQKFMRNRKVQLARPEKRVFPKSPGNLSSTRAYVDAYWQMNGLTNNYALSLTVDKFFEPLNEAPTTWPEPETEVATLIEAAQAMGKLQIIHVK
jgi:hypothetical protein